MPWKDGWTVNISQSGVLVILSAPAEWRGDIELVINLSKGALQGPGVALLPDLHCRGHVVRHQPHGDGVLAIAANIRRQVLRLASTSGPRR